MRADLKNALVSGFQRAFVFLHGQLEDDVCLGLFLTIDVPTDLICLRAIWAEVDDLQGWGKVTILGRADTVWLCGTLESGPIEIWALQFFDSWIVMPIGNFGPAYLSLEQSELLE